MKVKFILFIFVLVWITLIIRVFVLAVESNSYYEKLSHSNTIKTEKIAPVRGEITDNKNRPIAINKLGFKIQLKPHLTLKKNEKIFNNELDNLLALLPGLNREDIISTYKKQDSYYNHDFIDIVNFISYNEIMPVYTKLNLRENIKIVSAPKRYYPYGSIAAHTIGYVSRANIKDIKHDNLLKLIGYVGKSGIENFYNTYLQGEAGSKTVKVNANNQVIKQISYEKAQEDRKLVLNIDIKLQKYISSLFKDQAGAVVVMDVEGRVLSASSFPEYDLNTFVSGVSHKEWNKLSTSLDKPFTNKITHGLYPPGSTIKTGLGLVYITNEIGSYWTVDCDAAMPLGKRVFRCWKKSGHKKTGIIKAIRESCDDYFYKGSLLVGIKKMSEGLKRYGLGQKTGIDLPNEFIGTVPSREWKKRKFNKPWYIGETVNTSIGQGNFLVTPIQMAQFTALMATSKLPTPFVAKKIGDTELKPNIQDVLNEEELKKLPIIQKSMYEVCNYPYGTATKYVSSKIKIAGKTGTAQVIGILQDIEDRELEHEMEYYTRSHAWFTTYGPYKNPQYVVLALVEHGGHGGSAAGKIVSSIYDKLIEMGYIKP
ncbi:MAG: penicillin-binding protein 2 [Thiovulaceae bacterium]|nr:penicillin-binding protein 2 [Sulfurimonadaceae bacterium]